MSNKEWFEGGQRFRYVGSRICSLKPAAIKLAYGDERLEQLREERAEAARLRQGRLRRLLSALARKRPAA